MCGNCNTSAAPNRSFPATLQALDAKVDTSTRNLLLRATLDDSEGLLPGMFARLVINLDQPKDVVIVPETAVSYSLHGNTVCGDCDAAPCEIDALDARGPSAHQTHIALVEADRHALVRHDHEIVGTVGQEHVENLIAFLHTNCDQA